MRPPKSHEHCDIFRFLNWKRWGKAFKQLSAASGRPHAGRLFVARYLPDTQQSSRQWVLKPHFDSGFCTVTLSLRPEGSQGGALVLSSRENGKFNWCDNDSRVDTRYAHTVEQHHGDVLVLKGNKIEHFVTPTRLTKLSTGAGQRYCVGVFYH